MHRLTALGAVEDERSQRALPSAPELLVASEDRERKIVAALASAGRTAAGRCPFSQPSVPTTTEATRGAIVQTYSAG